MTFNFNIRIQNKMDSKNQKVKNTLQIYDTLNNNGIFDNTFKVSNIHLNSKYPNKNTSSKSV